MNRAEKLRVLHDKLKRGERLSKAEQRFVDGAERPAEFYPTLEAAAEHYGVVRSALDRWKEGYPEGFVKTTQGYEAKGIAEARRRFLASGKLVRLNEGDVAKANDGEEPQAPAEGESFASLEELKARKMTLECQKMTAQIDILMGLYVRKAVVVKELRVVLYGLKDALMRVPAEVCYAVSGKTPAEAQEIVSEALRRVLTKANEIDFARFEAALESDGGVANPATRLPAARETNGRKPAPK